MMLRTGMTPYASPMLCRNNNSKPMQSVGAKKVGFSGNAIDALMDVRKLKDEGVQEPFINLLKAAGQHLKENAKNLARGDYSNLDEVYPAIANPLMQGLQSFARTNPNEKDAFWFAGKRLGKALDETNVPEAQRPKFWPLKIVAALGKFQAHEISAMPNVKDFIPSR